MQGAYKNVAEAIVVRWEGLPQETKTVPAGTFADAYKADAEVSHGLSTTAFNYTAGPAIRFVCDLDPTGPKARNVIPGGEILDTKSPHYRDQLELWRKNQTYDLAFKLADVLASAQKEFSKNAIGRIRFTP